MKKSRLIVAVAFVVMLCCALTVCASAKWWDENPFTDVKSSSWYYDAVRICNENGLFKGTTETTFGTSIGMDRAMLVTVLAADDDSFDAGKYTKSSFTDIRDGSWYMAAVEWANEKGIATGIGEAVFGPKNTVTRQELALMLMKYAEYKGMDVTTVGSVDLAIYPDASDVSSWATDAVKWTVRNGLISGTAQGDEVLLSPKGTATRATVAQIMVKFLALDPVYEINGNDISLYKIVYNENEVGSEGPTSESAATLARYIKLSLGVDLEVVSDESEISDYEILVGKTNREEAGVVAVDRDSFEELHDFICQVQGDYLVITGIDSRSASDVGNRSTLNLSGTEYAVYSFLEKEIGLSFYFGEEGTIAEPDPVISLEDGYTYIDGPEFKQRILYITKDGEEGYLGCEGYYEDWCVGYPHQLGNLMFGYWKTGEGDLTASDNPCFSDPDNIESLINNIRQLLAEKPTLDTVGLIQNDSDGYCTCNNCMEIYREYGSRCGTLIRMCNTVCETFEEEYPAVKYVTWAYSWSHKPPNEDIDIHENVIVYYNTIALCSSHTYSDSDCKFNKNSSEYIRKWGEAVDELYVWDHSGNFVDSLTSVPNMDLIRINAKYFDDNGAEGIFLNSMDSTVADFNVLRGFLFSRLYRDPQMSEEKYNYLWDNFMRLYYGSGWRALRTYLDAINELGGAKCQGWHSPTVGFYDYDTIISLIDTFDSYWAIAESGAETDKQLERVIISRCSWDYLKQCALYESMYKNGDETSRAAYVQANQDLYDTLVKYDVEIGSYQLADPRIDLSKSPEDWTA